MAGEGPRAEVADSGGQGTPSHDNAAAHLLGGGLWERHTELRHF